MKKYNHTNYDFNKDGNISLEATRCFLHIGRSYYRLMKREALRLKRIQNYVRCNGNDMYFLYKFAEEVQRRNLIQKVAEMCHTYAKNYKKYDILEVLKSTRSDYNKGKEERTVFRHKVDFCKFIAYNLTVSGYDENDIKELVSVIY